MSGLDPRYRQRILQRDGFRCVYCGTTEGTLEVDHIVARANGGTSKSDNLATACRPCNLAKSDKTLDVVPVVAPLPTKWDRRLQHLFEIERAAGIRR
jgi:5-methylcytosine-specific restriction endonuclease McrA